MAWTAATQQVRHSGGGKLFDQEVGCFQFPGTWKAVDLPTQLSQIYHASFTPWPQGTTYTQTGGIENIVIGDGTVGTTDGILTVSGTSIPVLRLTEHGGTAAALFVTYYLIGKS